MKKIMLLAAIAVFSFSSLVAQDIRFGVKGGVNFANLAGDFGASGYDDDLRDAKMKVGFHIGGLAEVKLSEKFALQPEVQFSNQGFKSSYEDFDEDRSVDYKVDLYYINVPIMAKFFPIENLAVEAGPQIGVLISAKNELNDAQNDLNSELGEDEVDTKDLYKTIDFGFNIGASYELESGLFFAARYNIGITKVDEEDIYDDIYDDVDFGVFSFSRKNRVIQLSVGFMF